MTLTISGSSCITNLLWNSNFPLNMVKRHYWYLSVFQSFLKFRHTTNACFLQRCWIPNDEFLQVHAMYLSRSKYWYTVFWTTEFLMTSGGQNSRTTVQNSPSQMKAPFLSPSKSSKHCQGPRHFSINENEHFINHGRTNNYFYKFE